jgi:hypothetical protein
MITTIPVAQWLRQLSGTHMIVVSNPDLSKLRLFDFHVHRNVKLYIADMYYMLYALSEQVCTLTCMCTHVCFCIDIFEHFMYFSNVYTCLYMLYTLDILGVLVCTTLVIWMYYAIVQELVILYREDLDRVSTIYFSPVFTGFFSRIFSSTFHTNFQKILKKIIVNFSSQFRTSSLEFSRLFLYTFLSTVPKISDFWRLKA